MSEQRYNGTIVSGRKDGKLANSDNIFDKDRRKMQSDINKEMKTRTDNSFDSLKQTKQSAEDGGENVITLTRHDGTSEQVKFYNGSKGSKGDKGDKGEVGMQGNSGVADASNKTLVNDAITGGETDFLSAEVGKLGILTYDCSKGGSVTHATLQDAINSVPTTFQKVGLTITYKSGNTIYRYTLKANAWSADPANWFSVEDKLSDLSSLYNDKIPTDSVEVNKYIAALKLQPYTDIVASTEKLYQFQIEIDDTGNITLIRFWNGIDITYDIFSGSVPAEELNYKKISTPYFTIVLRNLEKLGTRKYSYLMPVKYVSNSYYIDNTITISNKSKETHYYFRNNVLEGNLKINIVESDLEYIKIIKDNGSVEKIIGRPNYPTLYLKDYSVKELIFPFTSETQKIKFTISAFTDVEYKNWVSKFIVSIKNFDTFIHRIRVRKFFKTDDTAVCQVFLYDEKNNLIDVPRDSIIDKKGLSTIVFSKLKDFTIVINSALLPFTPLDYQYITFSINIEDVPYELKVDVDVEDDLRNVSYFPSNVLQQNYYDDNLTEKKGQLLRTDTIIVNQGNIGSLYSQRNYGFKVIGDDSSNIEYKFFTWSAVQMTSGNYDFTGIEQFLKDNYTHHNRSILRLFPSCFQENSSITYKGKKINFPAYVADIMTSENAQFVEFNGYWLLDINCEGVYTEYSKLLQAFGKWLDMTIIDEEKNIKAKDVILYIDFGLLGPWGEGNWYNLQMTATAEKLVRYVKDFTTYVPDIQINIGISLRIDNTEKYWKSNEFLIQSKEVKNNVGYVGMFIDNYGTAFPLVFKPNIKISSRYTARKLIEKYVQRGDFFTGELAGWQANDYWGGNDFLNTYNSFILFKQPYIRMHNMTVTTDKGSYPIKKISPQTYYVLNNVLSCVGFRYVLSVLNTQVGTASVSIEWELTNIGLNKCFFNIYELYYRVHEIDGTVIDTKIDYDLRTLKPWNDIPLLFAIGNGKYFNTEIPITDKTKDISIIIKDIKDIQSPLYLSNYGRLEDGSYLLWEK